MDGERAAEALRSRGFRVTIVGSQPVPGMPPGTIVRQQPAGGFKVAAADADLARGEPMSSARERDEQPLVQVAPSILSADFAALGRDIAAAERGGADLIHVDVMDGHFVPNITIGPPVVRAIKRIATRPLDVHLMIEEPDRYIEEFVAAGASMVSVHVEAVPHLHRTVTHIKKLGAKAGVVLNPSTPAAMLEDIAPDVDFVLVMSVNPGFGGQSFIPHRLKKLRRVRAVLTAAGSSAPIEIDGGVDSTTSPSRRRRREHPRRRPGHLRHVRSRRRDARAARGGEQDAGWIAPSRRAGARASACAMPKPIRWASSTTPTISSGSKSAARSGCATRLELPGDGGRRHLAAGHRGPLRVPPAGPLRRRDRDSHRATLLTPVRIRFDYEARQAPTRRCSATGHTVHAALGAGRPAAPAARPGARNARKR